MKTSETVEPPPAGRRVEPLVGLSERLMLHFDNILKTGSVSIGIGDGMLYVYEHVRGIRRVLPAWMAETGVPVEFLFVGPIRPA